MVDAAYPWILSLPGKMRLTRTETGFLKLKAWDTSWELKDVSPQFEQALLEGATRDQLLAPVALKDQPRMNLILAQLDQAGLLHRSLDGAQGRLATWMPLTPGTVFQDGLPLEGKLSRFAFLRRKEGRTILESPLRASRLVLYDWRASALLCAHPVDAGLLSKSQTEALLCLAANCGLLDGDEDPPSWDFHSLLFHSRSRAGRSRGPHGMVPTAKGVEDPTNDKESIIPFARPRLNAATEPTFSQVVQERHSERQQGSVPIAREQLNEFLWRVARDNDGRRPYPNAGKVYELETSLVVHRCAGLNSGIYRYQPRAHGLLPVPSHAADEFLQDAQRACGGAELPQILVVLSARFVKMNDRYRSIAYANILKNVGVVMQTMALTASAMGLAACPLGAGDADLFCRIFETDYAIESSVGELILGSKMA